MKGQIPTITTAAKITQSAKEKRVKVGGHKLRKIIKLLKVIEWRGDATGKTCPLCRAKKKDGHLADCQLFAAAEVLK